MRNGRKNMKFKSMNDNQDNQLLGTATNLSIELSSTDLDALIFMYQEEKLAMDVYNNLATQYDVRIFDKIANSEYKHMSSVENILINSGIDLNELQELEAGEFINEELQSLYDTLILQGSTSLEEALNVGIAIEEVDIADLNSYLEDENINPDIAVLYAQLEIASNHHLDAFTSLSNNDFFIA